MMIPLFAEDEKAACGATITRSLKANCPVFIVRCANFSKHFDQLEKFAAAYLLINALLMGEARGRILKFALIAETDRSAVSSVLNALRGLLRGEYSDLNHLSDWKSVVEQEAQLSATLVERIEAAVEFFRNAEIASGLEDFQRADVLLGVDEAELNVPGISQYTLEHPDFFNLRVLAGHKSWKLFFPEFFSFGSGLQIRMNIERQYAMVDIDLDSPDWLSLLFNNVEPIIHSKLYAVGNANR